MILYKITNTINNKVYIGITKTSLSKRWDTHKSISKSSHPKYKNRNLYVEMRSFGITNFQIEVIKDKFESIEDLYKNEIEYIQSFRDLLGKENVYNVDNGGIHKGKKKGVMKIVDVNIKTELNQAENTLLFLEKMYALFGGQLTEQENEDWQTALGFMEFVIDSAKEQK